jgi:Kef-type K+ transport system membrane component KefB
MSHPLQLLLLLTIVVAAAKLAGAAANRIGQPAVFGEILVGLVLGPTVLDILEWPMFLPQAVAGHGDAVPLLAVVRDLAGIGVILLMFVAGMETDLGEMRRVGKVAFWAATGGVVLPFAGGIAVSSAFGLPMLWEGIFVGTILTATSVSISAQTLIELGALRSREGSTILGAAVIDDVMGIVLLSLVVAFARASGAVDLGQVIVVVVRLVVFFLAAVAAGRFLAPVAAAAERLGVSEGLLGGVLVVAFLYAWAAEVVGGVAAITGSYMAGLLLAQTRFKEAIDRGIHPLTYSLFVPVFFISIGLQANGRELGARAGFTLVVVAVAIVAKAVGCGLFARLFGFTPLESLRVGVGMISRGEVGLIVAGYGLGSGIIGRDVFSASVIMVLVTTMVTPPLLRLTFPRRERVPAVVEETVAGPPGEASP